MKHKNPVLQSVMKEFKWTEAEARDALREVGERIIDDEFDEFLNQLATRSGYPRPLVEQACRIVLADGCRCISAKALEQSILEELRQHTSA